MGTYLVTGGAGFIGSHLVDRLLAEGNSVRIIDNFDIYYNPQLKEGNLSNALANKKCRLIKGDIRDAAVLREAMKGVDAVFHQAAQAGVRISMQDPAKTMEVNVVGTTNVLDAARHLGIKRVFVASSSSVLGKPPSFPSDETMPYSPLSPYAVSKVAGEYLAQAYSELYGMVIPSFRYFTVYGPRVRPDLAINIFMKAAIDGKEITVFGDGSKSRSFTYVDDVVDSLMLALSKAKRTSVYNIGSEERITVNELVKRILAVTRSRSRIAYKEPVKGDMDHSHASAQKAYKELGWKARISLDEGLKRYYEWLKKH